MCVPFLCSYTRRVVLAIIRSYMPFLTPLSSLSILFLFHAPVSSSSSSSTPYLPQYKVKQTPTPFTPSKYAMSNSSHLSSCIVNTVNNSNLSVFPPSPKPFHSSSVANPSGPFCPSKVPFPLPPPLQSPSPSFCVNLPSSLMSVQEPDQSIQFLFGFTP